MANCISVVKKVFSERVYGMTGPVVFERPVVIASQTALGAGARRIPATQQFVMNKNRVTQHPHMLKYSHVSPGFVSYLAAVFCVNSTDRLSLVILYIRVAATRGDYANEQSVRHINVRNNGKCIV